MAANGDPGRSGGRDRVEMGTIYLATLDGAARLASVVGPEQHDALYREYLAIVREAVEGLGAVEVKDVDGGVTVAFASPSLAVAGAVRTQQLLEERNRGADVALHARIGLGTGESLLRDGDYFGLAPAEAARLCAEAPAGGILVSDVTRRLAGRVEEGRIQPVGLLELKGMPEPTETFSVRWEPLHDTP